MYLKQGINLEGTILNTVNFSVSCAYFVVVVNKYLHQFHLHNSENRLKSVLFTI